MSFDILADPLFYAVVVPVIVLRGITKSLFGGGSGALTMPLLVLVLSPLQAAAIQLPLLMVMDIFAVRAYWRQWDRRMLWSMLPGIPLGFVAGALTFTLLDADGIRLVLGIVTLAFALNYWRHRFLGNAGGGPPLPRPVVGLLAATASYASFVAHAGSAPAQMVMLRAGLGKTAFVATLVVFFATGNYAKVGIYAALGLFTVPNLTASLVLLPLIPIGIVIGLALHKRIPQQPFFMTLHTLMLLVGAKLTWDGAAALWL